MATRVSTAFLPVLLLISTAPHLFAQAPQSLADIEAAGVRMAFEVASVKPNRYGAPEATSTFPLGPGDAYAANGGFFSATNQPLIAYLRFAYKLSQSDLLGLPAWVYDDRFDIDARGKGNPTKDQMRRMMQALLTDRFKLSTHIQRQTKPAFNLVVEKNGRTGPQLQAHSEKNGSCSAISTRPAPGAGPVPSPPSSRSGLQLPAFPCGSIGQLPASSPERGRIGGRDVTMARIAAFLTNPYTSVDRPVLDATGLSGTFDFSIEWSLRDDTGPIFLQALKEQLGLALKSTTATVAVLVVDHVEQPSAN